MRNRIEKIFAICFVMAVLTIVWNAPVWAETTEQATLTGTQADIELNREVTINWEKNGREVDYYFTPTENKRYLFVITNNDDRTPSLYCGADKLSWDNDFSEVDGKEYLQTPVLEAGTTYDIYFTSRSNETEIQLGFYDDIWHGVDKLDTNVITSKLSKGFLLNDSYWSRTKRYKYTPASDGTYKFEVSIPDASGIAEDDYDFCVLILDENGNRLENQKRYNNYNNDTEAYATANLKEGKDYYILLRNFSDINDYNYKLECTKVNLNLNSETNISWDGLGTDVYYFFTPEKTQSYVFTVTDNVNRVPNLINSDEEWKRLIYDVNGKIRLITPVLEAGKEYAIYISKATGETSVDVGFYDTLDAAIETVKTPYTDSIEKGVVRVGDGTTSPSNRIYKFTVPIDGEYTYSIKWPKNANLESDKNGIDAFIYDENFEAVATDEVRSNNNESDFLNVFTKLTEGKTYYLMVSNYSTESDCEYTIEHRYVDLADAEILQSGITGSLASQKTKMYRLDVKKDGVYEFVDTKATTDKEDVYIYDDEFNNITSKSQKYVVEKYNENNEKQIQSVSRKSYLTKGIYYVQLNNYSGEEIEYKIEINKEEFVDVDSIQFNTSSIEIEVGANKNITANITPSNVTFNAKEWKVSDDSIVSLEYPDSENVSIKGLKEGECDITVTALNGKKAVCHIVVKKAGDHKYNRTITKATTSKDGVIKDICSRCGEVKVIQTISHPTQFYGSKSNFVYDGKEKQLTLVVKDANGKTIDPSNYDVSYPSGRKDAGIHDAKITFKGNYEGTMTIKFEIKKATQKLKIKAPKKSMKVGSKVKIKIKASRNHGKVIYKISNKKIAIVKKGKIKAIKKGKVKLTVILKGTKNYKQKKVTLTIKVK